MIKHHDPGFVYRTASRRGLCNHRNMYWWYTKKVGLNFGDWIGPYLFKKMTGIYPKRIRPKNPGVEESFFAAGSILHHARVENSAIVWGSGAISKDVKFERPLVTYAVRGPKTREIYIDRGYSCPEIYGDPGLLMPYFFQPKVKAKSYRLGIVPHHADHGAARDLFFARPEVRIVNVQRDVESVIADIVSCEVIVSTSLHGLIIAHAYGVPAVQGVLTGNLAGGDFKFVDYHLGAAFEGYPRAIDLNKHNSTKSLAAFCRDAPVFARHDIQKELLETCPFDRPLRAAGRFSKARSDKRKHA